MELTLLVDLIRVLFLATVVMFACSFARVPPMVGLLLTGVLSGPSQLGLVRNPHDVEALAEIGVVLLLFTIGLEFSLGRLIRLRRAVLIGGGVQVIATIAVTTILALLLDVPLNAAIFLGFLLSLSSTAIVLKTLEERAQIESPQGQITVAILLFQDMIVMAMILLTPALAGEAGNLPLAFIAVAFKFFLLAVFVYVAAKWIMPRLLFSIARTRSRELFMLTILVICMITPWIGYKLGLSIGLGAFIAGLIISETDYSYQALAGFVPFRDVLTSLFFVSIGMLLDVDVTLSEPLLIVLGVLALMLLKALIATISVLILRYPLRMGLLAGLALAQIGEFSFILAAAGLDFGLLNPDTFQRLVAMTILSMAATPFLIALAPRLAASAPAMRLAARLPFQGADADEPPSPETRDHVIIIGFGLSGHNLARALRAAGVPYLVLEMNAETVRREKIAGEPIIFGDATQHAVLKMAAIATARTLVVSIPDPAETRKITDTAHKLNPSLDIVARTRFASEINPLLSLGAGEVVADEFEASTEIIAHVLRRHSIPRDEIEQFLHAVRAEGYHFLQDVTAPWLENLRLHPEQFDIISLHVPPQAQFAGRKLAEIRLRQEFDLTLLAIRREGQLIASPAGEEIIQADDMLVVFGPQQALDRFRAVMTANS